MKKYEGNLHITTKSEWEKYKHFEEITGYLDLQGTQITALPDNLTVGGSLYLQGTQITALPDNLTVGGSLDLQGTQITALPDNLTVGGSLDLQGTQITALPDNLTVGGYLDLQGTQITALPDNLTVGGYLYLRGTQITALPDNLTVGGSLDLRDTKITALPDNLTVGGYLYLQGTQITALPDNLTVGGSLDLRDTKITALPDNLTVGGSLDLQGTQITAPKNLKRPAPDFKLKMRMSVELKFNIRGYTIADGILAKILNTRKTIKKILIAGRKIASYLANDDKGNYAHGATISEATQELAFKTGSRDIEQFRNLAPDTKKTPQEWAFVYRMVTGACQSGTQHFIASKGKLKAKYTLTQIIKETAGAYGHDRFVKTVAN